MPKNRILSHRLFFGSLNVRKYYICILYFIYVAYLGVFTVNSAEKKFQQSSIAQAISFPVALYTFPSPITTTFDQIVAIALPYHMWCSTKYVIQDYMIPTLKNISQVLWSVLCVISGMLGVFDYIYICVCGMFICIYVYIQTGLGLIKLSYGDGICGTLKSFWYPPHKTPIQKP